MKHRASVKRRTRRQQKKTRKTRHHRRQRQYGGESSVDMPLGSIVIERDAGDKYSPFLAVERDTARRELSASSII
jgi:hypothetical protein